MFAAIVDLASSVALVASIFGDSAISQRAIAVRISTLIPGLLSLAAVWMSNQHRSAGLILFLSGIMSIFAGWLASFTISGLGFWFAGLMLLGSSLLHVIAYTTPGTDRS
jgi:hypothetical protein